MNQPAAAREYTPDNSAQAAAGRAGAAHNQSRLAFADGLRGLAALWVVLFHMSEGGHIGNIKALMPRPIYAFIFDCGDLGVAVFFVLSGFVMALTVQRVRVDAPLAGRFILRRLIRLAPPYYFAIAVTLALIFVKAKTLSLAVEMPGPGDLAAHAFFLQGLLSIPNINIVYWTLCIEVQFYVAFAILFLVADSLKYRLNIVHARIGVVMAACAVALLWPIGLISSTLWTGGFMGFWYSFLAGVLACWGWSDRGRMRCLILVYCAILAIAGIVTHSGFTLVAALTAALLTVAGMMGKMHTWLSWSSIRWLGLISYSLYLLHNPITGATFRVVHRFLDDGLFADVVGMMTVLTACLGVSWIAYLMVERPSIAWSHSISLRTHPSRNRQSVTALP